ncbi:MAG: S-methyl-5'-thioadenosine phosphorylase [Dehalococcoidales bacterium]|nr:S-methyl-5'-thioadenosine phosphorylase [Dehalococcoidales bacterium]
MSHSDIRLAVIGGTGLYEIDGIKDIQEVQVPTPFGMPSDAITLGRLDGVGVAFLARHGRHHTIPPSRVPYRANIYALKSLGVEFIIASNSCGSFREALEPGHLLVPDQIIDRTCKRESTFFDGNVVAHVQFAEPFCPLLSEIVYESARRAGATVHKGGTFIAMEGPAFSTRAESRLYKAWGADVIGMTVLPEAKLAREAEICYASIACITDYDSWHEKTEAVSVEAVLTIMRNNIDLARRTIRLAARALPEERTCACTRALKDGLVTDLATAPAQEKQRLGVLIEKYARKA